MKWMKICTVAVAVCSLMFATVAFAQQGRPANQADKPVTQADKPVTQADRAHNQQGFPAGMYRGSKLIGADVENPQGEDLGDINDVVFDAQGRVAYAVLAFGGFLGLGEKYFAVPWTALQPKAGERPGDVERYVLNVDKERLKNAPGFDKNNWPNMADRSWAEQIHAFYGVSPYWEQREARVHGATPSMTSMPSAAMITATIQHIDQNSKLIRMRTANDEVVEMQAPAGLLSRLQDGDRVEVVIHKQAGAAPPAAGQPAR